MTYILVGFQKEEFAGMRKREGNFQKREGTKERQRSRGAGRKGETFSGRRNGTSAVIRACSVFP